MELLVTKQGETVIEFRVPLPPVSLRSNSRAHWATKKRDADKYSRNVFVWAWAHIEQPSRDEDFPWSAARVHYAWHYCGAEPDLGNIPGNVKYLQDVICCAPKNGAGADRFYLGLVENDRYIEPSYSMVKEKRRAAEAVIVRIEKR